MNNSTSTVKSKQDNSASKIIQLENDSYDKQNKPTLNIVSTLATIGTSIAFLFLLAKNKKVKNCVDKLLHSIFKPNNNDKQRTRIYRTLPKGIKQTLIYNSEISTYIKQCKIEGKNPDPIVILNKLKKIQGIKIKEKPFKVKENSLIQNGRKFEIKVNSRLKMVFEVHDYKNSDGTVSWVMRFYDNDKKNLRSYLTSSGSFIHTAEAYNSPFAHISCSQKGQEFVFAA